MRGGIANFTSTYWPVGDAAAKNFAGTFYEKILAGDAIGKALLQGRRAIMQQRTGQTISSTAILISS